MRKVPLAWLAILASVTACARGQEPARSGQSDKRPSVSASPSKPVLCPLTGTPGPRGFDVDRPALSVKIENSPEARPQAGLQEADIVYEELAEGGITRFNAIYHCNDASQLGPIRSARLVDADILVEYAPVLFAYAGAAPPVQSKVAATRGITDLSRASKGYRRESSRPRPHNLFSSTQQLRSLPEAARVRGAPKIGLEFDTSSGSPSPGGTLSPGAGGSPAAGSMTPATGGNEVSFSFGGRTPSRYTFDPASGTYLRFHGSEPHRTVSGSQIKVTNVVILKVQVRPGTIRDAAGNLSPDITVIGSGEALVLSGGKSTTGRWNRPGISSKTTLTDASGAPISLKPGNTWIHLVPAGQPVSTR